MVNLGSKEYEFTTYNQNKIVNGNINFGNNFEGKWNYIYFGYKRLLGISKGYV